MTIPPVAIGVGAGVAVGIASGFGLASITSGIGDRNPTGSSADGKARGVLWGAGLTGGVLGVGGGMYAVSRGNAALGAGLIGAGIGAAIGAGAAGIAFGHSYGIGVDTQANDIFSSYNRDFDDVLDLDPGWRTPENVRVERQQHDHDWDGDGDTDSTTYTYTYHTIDRLTNKANVNGDGKVTRPELHDAVASYDSDGNGRLKGEERKTYEREVGERAWYGSWSF
ncbi:MAG: hypothetical protein JWM98_250 [Thermoleophilia bacterium]|nr:hypothetical protein [Thermoleophilia bacterium]